MLLWLPIAAFLLGAEGGTAQDSLADSAAQVTPASSLDLKCAELCERSYGEELGEFGKVALQKCEVDIPCSARMNGKGRSNGSIDYGAPTSIDAIK
jgi:hypothetical protein